MRKISYSKQFKRDFKKHALLTEAWFEIIYLLLNDKPLPEKYKDHALTGNYTGFRDCHVKPDLVLIYRKTDDNILELLRLGSHAELF